MRSSVASVLANSGGVALDAGGETIEMYAGSHQRVFINTSGQIGIGQNFTPSRHLDIKDSTGVLVTRIDNDDIRLQKGDIILEVNRELVDSLQSFIMLIDKYKKTGRSSLLLKIKRDDETSWITIKFISS